MLTKIRFTRVGSGVGARGEERVSEIHRDTELSCEPHLITMPG